MEGDKINILLIDDDNINNYVSENVIKKMNVANYIEKKLNGKEGLEFIKKNNPDLILVDINMPVMDGMEFLSEFNHINTEKKMIVYLMHTAPLTPAQKEKISKVHLDGNIEKPLNKEKLLKVIEQHFYKLS
jgi:response regulator RpfG family c-di-GMP phosphodiesterase